MFIKTNLCICFLAGISLHCFGQDAQSISSDESSQESHTIILSPGRVKPPTFLYSASARAEVRVNLQSIEHTINLQLRVVQGEGETVSLGLGGAGDVIDVQGESIASWAVRTADSQRFLDLQLKPKTVNTTATVRIRSKHTELPTKVELAHLTPGKALGFDSQIQIMYAGEVAGKVVAAEGFAPLVSGKQSDRLQTATGGRLMLQLERQSALRPAVELLETVLTGAMHPSGKSISFQLRSTANVSVAGTRLTVLAGNVAISKLPESADYQLELVNFDTGPKYEIIFPKVGNIPIIVDFVAGLKTVASDWQGIDFTVAASAVVPIQLQGLDTELEFARDQQVVAPLLVEKTWQGFLPATGKVTMRWRNARTTVEGKSFFTTNATIETTVGPGLLRQDHRIAYQLLQGQLDSLKINMIGPGEILKVDGNHIVAWKIAGEGNQRQLEITLNQPLTGNSEINVRSQTPLGTFPVRVEGLSLQPQGAIRNSGHLRISNAGSVSVEPTGLRGLTQLAPEQFPGEGLKARQIFVYRFPSSDYGFTIAADRVQPEISVTQLVLYQLSESDRVILADVELDIREAAIRDWSFNVPEDYSIVSVTGASLADYMASTETVNGQRNVKLLFGADTLGRQLIGLRLEKNEAATTGPWNLPHIQFPDAKAIRGDIGIVAAPGFRATVGATDLLVEKPLSYFPRPIANLQQAFRIREPGWTATIQIERLERSIQSDVFHLYSLSQGTVYGSALINYAVTGAPVAEWQLTVPAALGNVTVDGRDIRTWRREGDTLIVSLQQPVLGAYTLLVTFEEKPNAADGSFQAGQVAPLGVQGDRGYVEVVSPVQVEMESLLASSQLLKLDPLELPAEFRLLSTAPALGTWQYTSRPFDLRLKVNWFDPGTTAAQVVEFSEANSRVSQDGELVTDLLYYVKSRGQRTLKLQLPGEPVKLWAVSVNGRPVTARQSGDETLIPLPGSADPNVPIEVSLRLGKPAVEKSRASLELPTVFAPVLKTQWNLKGDENHVLVPSGGTVEPTMPVLWPTGFDWLGGRGLMPLVVIAVLVCISFVASSGSHSPNATRLAALFLKLVVLAVVIFVAVAAAWDAFQNITPPAPLQLNLPVLASGEKVGLDLENIPSWRVFASWPGIMIAISGIILLALGWRMTIPTQRISEWLVRLSIAIGFALVSVGLLLQSNGATWFFGFLAVTVFVCQFLPAVILWKNRITAHAKVQPTQPTTDTGETSVVATAILLLLTGSNFLISTDQVAWADQTQSAPAGQTTDLITENIQPASSLIQTWMLSSREMRLTASATMTISGRAGDRFVLLRSPAVLTKFDGPGLRLSKVELPSQGVTYIVTIPSAEGDAEKDAPDVAEEMPAARQFTAHFQYQVEAIQPAAGIPVLTGNAALKQIDLTYDEAKWEVVCESAARIETIGPEQPAVQAEEGKAKTELATGTVHVKILLGPGPATVFLRPQARDLMTEATQYFVEGAGLYTPGPGVIDGKHRLNIRTSQGRVQQLSVVIPTGLTVSTVGGPVSSWQFDADKNRLQLQIDPTAPPEFSILIETQRSLDALPTTAQLSPLRVEGAIGEVGLIALAFGTEAQPESVQAESLSLVNIGDFDANLVTNPQTTLHRVYRYGAEAGHLIVQVSPVSPEVRVASKQVLSLGDERIVLGINFVVEITRTGLFQLSFPLPTGLEVESLTGESLHHWSELTENGQRQILLHLKGKTIGAQKFALALAGAAPSEATEWTLPRFELKEASRQSGELTVQPTTGIRLRSIARQNVSEADPRSLGAQGQGALAFRLLQRDWNLRLGIEKLAPWVTGQVLHEVILREGQTRSTLMADFNIQNAAIRTLVVKLPSMGPDEIKTVRASGETVSDFVRSGEDGNQWEIRFKRRVIGAVQFQIEYERRGERVGDSESLNPVDFPDARQLGYYFAVRSGGRLEIETGAMTQGWQRNDWSSVPQPLRDAGNRNAPALALRAMSPTTPLSLKVVRHSLAEALKLRVASGTLTTILSPTGDQLTSVDVNMEVIQRSSLMVQLPSGGELFSIFVNGESVHSVRQKSNSNTWQFYILPGIDDRTAQVRFVYSLVGESLTKLDLVSPQLNVPLENIQWNVIAPKGFDLIRNDGNLELVGQDSQGNYDRQSYLSSIKGKRQDQAQQATKLLEQANQLLQTGEQTKAQWAFNNVANRYALDAASNEDARVQLENLQTQQAIVGLNTRRQRLFLDNNRGGAAIADNDQLRQAAAVNPILQQEQLNFRPQELSQLLAGNSKEDNANLQQIAGRIVQHQRTTEPAPQAITISLPEEGNIYRFRRSVQVAENAPLTLELGFSSEYKVRSWQWLLIVAALAIVAVSFQLRRSSVALS
jgi:hypothetical protein